MTALSGVVAVLTRADGEVMTTVADFGGISPGYSSINDAQRGRARQALANAFLREWAIPDIAEVCVGYDADRLIERLADRKGYKVTLTAVSSAD